MGLLVQRFKNKSNELKFDIFHQEYKGWQGAWTLHYKHSDFEAIGEEAFSPPSKTDSFAVAWLEEKHFGDVLFQLGARVERVTIDADDTTIGFSDHEIEQVSFSEQSFTPLSTSLGLVWDYQTGYNIGLSLAVSQRAPSAVELFSFGSHIGTGTFEVGSMYNIEDEGGEIHVELSSQDPNVESSYSIDLSWRKFEGDLGFVVNAFYNQINDYYYQQDTGLVFESEHDEHEEEEHEEDGHDDEDGTPILAYLQNDVDMYGVEAEVFYQVSGSLKASVFGDYIKAKLSDGGDLPRIPPMRIGTSLQYQGNNFDGELNVNHYFEQDNIGSLETVTESYSMVDINMNYYFDASGNDLVLYVKGNNLTDDVGKVHSSFLKDISPLPGRNFSVGIRGSF